MVIDNKKENKDWLIMVLVIAFFVLLPFLLNWILQKPSFTSVVGNEETWLSFWAKYIGAILTAIMVVATFITIRRTANINKTQWKIGWLKDYRNAAVDILLATNTTSITQIAQDIIFGRYESAVEKGNKVNLAVKKSYYLITSVMKEYDDLFENQKSDTYIKKLDEFMNPFKKLAGELIQFGLICNYLKEKEKEGKIDEGKVAVSRMLDDMKNAGYSLVVKAINEFHNGNKEDVIHNTVISLQNNFSDLDMDAFENLLLSIGEENAKKTYNYCFCMYICKDKEQTEN